MTHPLDKKATRVVDSPRVSQALSATDISETGPKSVFQTAVDLGSPYLAVVSLGRHYATDAVGGAVGVAGVLSVAAVLHEPAGADVAVPSPI